MDLTSATAWVAGLGLGAVGAVFLGFGLLGELPGANVAPGAVNQAVIGLAALLPIGAGVAGARGVSARRPPWKLRLEPTALDKLARVFIGVGVAVVAGAVLASLAFGAATKINAWWTVGDIAAVALWPDPKVAWGARFALAAPIITGFLLALPALVKPRRLHGSARFGTWRDAAKAKLDSAAGIVLGKMAGRQLIYGGEGHVLGVAPSRSGKGVGWIVPTLLEWPGSVVTADPKLENYLHTSGWRQKQGHAVHAFNPFSNDSARWNPLQYVKECESDPSDEIDRVARILYPDSGKESHWIDGARGAFRGAVAHLWTTERSVLCLGMVARWAAVNLTSEDRLNELVAGEAVEPLAVAEIAKLLATPSKERGSFLSTMNTVLSPWLLPSIDLATCESDFDFKTLRTKRQAIHFCLTPDNAARSVGLQRLFWQQIIDALTRRLPTEQEPWPVLILLDEFTLPGPLPLIMESAAFLAGYGVKLFLVVQSRHQLEATYDPARTKALLDTMAVRVYYAPNDQTSAEQLSAELGTANFRTKSRNRSQGKTSVSYSDQRRPLMLPQEVLQLGVDTVLVLSENSPPIKGTKERFYLSRRYKPRAAIKAVSLKRRAVQVNTATGTPGKSQQEAPGNGRNNPRVGVALSELVNALTTGDDKAAAEAYLREFYG